MESNTSLQQQLLEAGVHFGHLKKKWNPKMLPYIFAEKKGIHIIDLNKTVEGLQETAAVMKQMAKAGKKILFVATKKAGQGNCDGMCTKGKYALRNRPLAGRNADQFQHCSQEREENAKHRKDAERWYV